MPEIAFRPAFVPADRRPAPTGSAGQDRSDPDDLAGR